MKITEQAAPYGDRGVYLERATASAVVDEDGSLRSFDQKEQVQQALLAEARRVRSLG